MKAIKAEVLIVSAIVLVIAVVGIGAHAMVSLSSEIREMESKMDALHEENRRLNEMLEATTASGGMETVIEPVANDAGFVFPVAPRDYMMITSPDGPRISPFLGVWVNHSGIDIAAVYRAVAVASADGVVAEHWPPPGTPIPGSRGVYRGHPIYGGMIRVRHENGVETLYAHFNDTFVRTGQSVRSGQPIGRIGATGLSTGVHLHFEVIVDGESVNPLHFVDIPHRD